MTGFFDNNVSPGLTTSQQATDDGILTGFYPTAGIPTMVSAPFDGVLKASSAVIGHVVLDNPVASLQITNFPGNQATTITNWPSSLSVNVLNMPGTQPVSVTNLPQTQNVSGAVSITNWPASQPVTLSGDSTVRALLLAGTSHIGGVSVDGPITGSVSVTNFPNTFQVSNFPAVQAVNGTVGVNNFPTGFQITNSDAQSIPVKITGGASSFTGTLSAGTSHIGSIGVDGLVKLDDSTAIKVEVINQVATSGGSSGGTFSGSLSAGTAHIGSIGVDGLVKLDDSTAINVALTNQQPYPEHLTIDGGVSVSNFPSVQQIAGTVSLASNAVSVSNFPTSFNIGNLPGVQAVSLDTSTAPLNVTVVGGSTGGGSSFNGVLAASSATIGSIQSILSTVNVAGSVNATIQGTPTVALANSTVKIDSTTPVNVALPSGAMISGYNGVSGLKTVLTDGNGNLLGVPTGQPSSALAVQMPGNGQSSPLYVKNGGGFTVSIQKNGSEISATNPLFSTQVGTANVAVQGSVSTTMIGADGVNPVSPTNGLPVAVVAGGSSGGSSFSGQLTQANAAVSATNPLYVQTATTGVASWVEFSGTQSASTFLTGATRTNPGGNLQFALRTSRFSSYQGGVQLQIQGSNDGSTWALVKVMNFASGPQSVTIAVDAVGYTYFRGLITNGGSQVDSTFEMVTYFTTAAVDAPVTTQAIPLTYSWVDGSGWISTGNAGTWLTLFAQNTARRGFWVQNLSTSDIFISINGTTKTTAIKIPAGGMYECPAHGVPANQIYIYGEAGSQFYSAASW